MVENHHSWSLAKIEAFPKSSLSSGAFPKIPWSARNQSVPISVLEIMSMMWGTGLLKILYGHQYRGCFPTKMWELGLPGSLTKGAELEKHPYHSAGMPRYWPVINIDIMSKTVPARNQFTISYLPPPVVVSAAITGTVEQSLKSRNNISVIISLFLFLKNVYYAEMQPVSWMIKIGELWAL